MADSLKERLRASVHIGDPLSTGALYHEALARIEDLEKAVERNYSIKNAAIATLQDKLDRAVAALTLIGKSHQWTPNTPAAILDQCINIANSALSDIKVKG